MSIEINDGCDCVGCNNPRTIIFISDGTYDQDTVDTAAKELATYLDEHVSFGFVEALYYELQETIGYDIQKPTSSGGE